MHSNSFRELRRHAGSWLVRGEYMITKCVAAVLVCFSAFVACAQTGAATAAATPVYEVYAIRYASIPDFPINALVAGADPQRKLSIAMTVWLIRGNGRNILVDSG